MLTKSSVKSEYLNTEIKICNYELSTFIKDTMIHETMLSRTVLYEYILSMKKGLFSHIFFMSCVELLEEIYTKNLSLHIFGQNSEKAIDFLV
jgi:hypothetical protein